MQIGAVHKMANEVSPSVLGRLSPREEGIHLEQIQQINTQDLM